MKYSMVILLGLLAQVATASPIVIPSHSNLLERADVVVTATFVKTDETEERRRIGPHDAQRILSSFRIDSVLKRKSARPEIVVGHYRQPPSNSPFDAVRLTTQHFSFIAFSDPNEKYLIYLKKQKSGAYAPVTGEIDPQFSFWKLNYKKETIAEQSPAGDSKTRAAGAASGTPEE